MIFFRSLFVCKMMMTIQLKLNGVSQWQRQQQQQQQHKLNTLGRYPLTKPIQINIAVNFNSHQISPQTLIWFMESFVCMANDGAIKTNLSLSLSVFIVYGNLPSVSRSLLSKISTSELVRRTIDKPSNLFYC